jgi:hypothetical protein
MEEHTTFKQDGAVMAPDRKVQRDMQKNTSNLTLLLPTMATFSQEYQHTKY